MTTDNQPPSNDMVDSGVGGSQHKSTGKEGTAAGMDEDEDISLSCEDRPTLDENIEKESEGATGYASENPSTDFNDDDKKDDEAS